MRRATGSPEHAGRFGLGPQVVVLVLVLGLVGAMAIQPTRQLLAQRARIEAMARDVRNVEGINRALEARIGRLEDPDYVEQRARSIGLIKPGETRFVVMPPSRTRAQARRRAAARREKSPPTPEPGAIEGFLRFVGVL
ncbi:MAG: septum formation initiator family protein [Actinomycetota bacterium]